MTHFNHYIEGYVHNNRIGVLIEFDVSDFTTRTDVFRTMARDIAMHVASSAPDSVDSLLQQPFIKDVALTVGQLIFETAKDLREEISIKRFVRWDKDPERPIQTDPPRSPATIHRLRDTG